MNGTFFRVVTIMGFVALVGGLLMSRGAAPTGASSLASRNVYLSNCARCHGADGRADTEGGRLYDVPDISGGKLRRWSNKRLTGIVNRGVGSMPGFEKKLTRRQIASVIDYIKSL